MIFFSALWAKAWGYIVGAGAVLAVVLGIYAKGREDNKSATIAAQNKQRIQDLQQSKAIHEKVTNLPADDVDKSLNTFMRD